jgi:PKD repeat protein
MMVSAFGGIKIAVADNPPDVIILEHPQALINYTEDIAFSWVGYDDETPTGNLTYRFILKEKNDIWKPWKSWTSKTYDGLEEGDYKFKVQAKDEANNTVTAKWSFMIDITPPPAPLISSSTHPNQYLSYCNQNPTFTWTIPIDDSGIDCYSYILDNSPATIPDGICDTSGTIYNTLVPVGDGTWYFHVRAKDNAGNWGPASHYQIIIGGCDHNDDWYVTNEYRWVDDPYCIPCECKEREQRKHEYRDYYCDGSGTCLYHITNVKWVYTGYIRNKPDGTICDYGFWENDPDNVCRERRKVFKCHQGVCPNDIYDYEYRNKPDGTDCGFDYYDDWVYYCSGDTIRKHRLYHDFYCEDGECSDHAIWTDDQLVENCNDYDQWYDTNNTRWINDSTNNCKEKNQMEQEYRDYSCSNGVSIYTVTSTQWIDTGTIRNKPEGTICGYEPWENDPNNPCKERRIIYKCLNGTCSEAGYEYRNKPEGTICDYGAWENDSNNSCKERRKLYVCLNGVCTENGYEYRNKPDGTDCGFNYHDDWVYYCSGDTIRKHRLYHDFYCEGGECTDHTSWRDDEFVENCNDHDGWYSTGDMRWINDSEYICQEKEQREESYRDYTCQDGVYVSNVIETRWIDTGNRRNKPDGIICGYGPGEEDPLDTCCENRLVYICHNGTAVADGYEYREKPNINCVSVNPATIEIPIGEIFTINVTINPKMPLAGAQFDLFFNSSLVTIKKIEEGNLLNHDGINTFFTIDTLDNSTGIAKGIASVIISPQGTVSSFGSLATITLQATHRVGNANIILSNVIVGDQEGNSLPIAVNNGNITIVNNMPPLTPDTPSGSSHGYIGTTYSYTVHSIDPDGGMIQYEFDWGDNSVNWTNFVNSGEPISLAHSWNTPGTYYLKAKAKDYFGEQSKWSSSFTVTIIVPPSSPANQPPVSKLTANLTTGVFPLDVSFLMTANDPDGAISSWKLDIDNDGIMEYSGSGNPPPIQPCTYLEPGNYTAKLTVIDNDGKSDRDSIKIIINPSVNQPPEANFQCQPKNSIKKNTPVTLIDRSSDPNGQIINWTWNFGDELIMYGSNVTHTYTIEGNHSVTLTVMDDEGETDSYSLAIMVLKDDVNDGIPGFDFITLIISLFGLLFLLIKKR